MSLNSNPIARITKATRALFAPFITPHKRQTIKKRNRAGKRENKNITFHIWFFGGIFPSLARSLAEYCNCEWDSYVGPQPIPPPPLLLPVTVTTHTCTSRQSQRLSGLAALFTTSHALLLKPLINSQVSHARSWHMPWQLKGFISKVFTDKRKIYVASMREKREILKGNLNEKLRKR